MARVWARVMAAGLFAGCQSAAPKAVYDGNPLLQARQPLVSAPANPAAVAYKPVPTVVPVPQAQPVDVGPTLVGLPPPHQPPASVEPPVAESPVAVAAAVEPVPLPVAPALPKPVAAEPVPQVPAGSTLARGSNYAWLQGKLEHHYRGYHELRFCPCTEDEPIGGKVELADDPRLAAFREGDLIRVTGELIGDPNAVRPGRSPRYAISTVTAVK